MSVLSLIQKNLRPVQMCILCAVREELTYICRVCLTKSSYPLFQAGKSLSSKVFILEMKGSSVSGREDLALRAKNKLSSVSGREEFIL